MARYREIAQDLRARLAAGEFQPGDRLPSITLLQEHYNVPGLNTIRQAQQLLVDEGLIETRQGSGAFVLRTTPEQAARATSAVAPDERAVSAVLASAGITADDVEAVVRWCAGSARATALSMVDALVAARSALALDAGADVPEGHRYGRGARLTDTDLVGAYRTLSAAREHWLHVAAEDNAENLRTQTLRAMARREANGEHEVNQQLIDAARV